MISLLGSRRAVNHVNIRVPNIRKEFFFEATSVLFGLPSAGMLILGIHERLLCSEVFNVEPHHSGFHINSTQSFHVKEKPRDSRNQHALHTTMTGQGVGQLCLRAVSNHGFSGLGPKLEPECIKALFRSIFFLKISAWRIMVASSKTWYIFTDACYEPTSSDWPWDRRAYLQSCSANIMIDALLRVEAESSSFPRYVRVLSPSNPSDEQGCRDEGISGTGEAEEASRR